MSCIGFCDYPTYYNSDSGECVLTCPSGTIGNVSRTANVTMRNCTSCELKYYMHIIVHVYYSYMQIYSYSCKK